MGETVRFGLSMDSELLEKFDKLISKKGYPNRSEAVRDLVRNQLVEEEWESAGPALSRSPERSEGEVEGKEIVGTITLVYNHETRDLADKLTDLQHHLHLLIISTLHVHLDEHNCLEVLVVKGKSSEVKRAADRLIGTKGVKHGKLIMTTTGKEVV
jgi:CopG family nickel-responsive transcriptional regulator